MNITTQSKEYCEQEAENASLTYVNDKTPGITRKKRGKGFSYYSAKGSLIKDIKTL